MVYDELARMLGYHPLALIKIFHSLKKRPTARFQDYLNLLKRVPQEVLTNRSSSELSRHQEEILANILKSLSVSVDDFLNITEKFSTDGKKVAKFVVSSLAYLPFTTIPLQLMSEIIKIFLKFMSASLIIDQSLLERIMDELIHSNLIDCISEEIIGLHQLMRMAFKMDQYTDETGKSVEFLFQALNAQFEYEYAQPPDVHSPVYRIYLSQIEALLEERKEVDKSQKEKENIFRLYLKLGNYHYYETRNHVTAKYYYKKAEVLLDDVEPDNEEKSNLFYHLAHLLYYYRNDEVEDNDQLDPKIENYVKSILLLWGDDLIDRPVTSAYSCLALEIHALIARRYGQFATEKLHYKRCLAYLNSLVGFAPKDVAHINYTRGCVMSSMGNSFYEHKDYDSANRYLSLAIEEKKKLISRRASPDILILLRNLGELHMQKEKYKRAKYFFEEALSHAKRLYGEEISINHIELYYFLATYDEKLGQTSVSQYAKSVSHLLHNQPSWVKSKDVILNSNFLEIAARVGHLEGVQMLCENHAITQVERMEALFLAAAYGQLNIVIWFFEEKFVDFSAEDSQGNGVLLYAANAAQENVVKWLFGDEENQFSNRKVTGKEKNSQGDTVLLLVAQAGNLSLVQWVIENKLAEQNESNHEGKTAMKIAEERGYVEMAEYLRLLSNESDRKVVPSLSS